MGSSAGSGLISFQRIPIPEEVPAHLCTALAQDHDGFLWIGTQGGLVRYDGYQFRVFREDPKDPGTLGGSYVRSLLAASDGRVWVGTFSGGLSVYDPATERFLRFRHDPRDPRSLADDLVRGLLVDRSGQVWVGGKDGLQVWRGEGRGFSRVASDPRTPGSLAGELVSKLYEDGAGRIWIGTTDHGAAVLDPRAGSLRRLRPRPAAAEGLSHFWVYGFAEAGPDEIWIATFGGGIDVVDPRSLAVMARLQHDPTLDDTVGGDRIGALLRDRSGLLWVGTWGQGLAHHDPATRAFRALRSSPERPDGLSHPEAVRALEMRDGTIWVGTNGNGVDVLDREGRRIGGYRPDPQDPGALSDGSITCLAQATDGTIWVATLNGSLHRLRPGSRRFDRLSPSAGDARVPGGPIRTLAFGPDGALWVGAAEGMARIDPRTLKSTIYRHRPGDAATLSGTAVESLAFAAGTLWVGTDNGLNAFDPRTGIATPIPTRAGSRDGLPASWVPDLLVTRCGRLWVGTSGGAAILESWDGKTARFLSVSEKLGRPPAPVEALIEDREGQVWLGPRLRVDPRTWRSRELGPADGCAFRNFFIASRSRTAGGTLLFGSPEGLLFVQPERLRPWTYAPPLVATALQVDGRERPGASRLQGLTLLPAERGFRLHFAALDWTAPARNAYRYRLEGYDDGWNRTGAGERSLAYTRLPPGSYTLRVQGTNRAGLWSPSEIRLPVTIRPAFYQTLAFRALLALLALGLAYLLYRLRVRRLTERGRELERLVALRTQEIAEKNRELETAYARIEEASLTDPLTGLRNRRFLEQTLGADLELALRRHENGEGGSGEADLVFLLLDLDHFKSVNDTHGHGAGDAVLVQAAAVLRATTRASDRVVRWGGEEFLVVARFCDRRGASGLAEAIRAAIEAHPFELPDGSVLRRTGSLGFAAFPLSPSVPRAVIWQEVVGLADLGLYAAKRSGRNRWVGVEVAAEGDPAAAVERFREDPEAALARQEVRVQAPEGEAAALRWA